MVGEAGRRLAVFGATGGTGRKIVELALSQGFQVTVLVRSAAKLGGVASRVRVEEGDVLDQVAVDRAVAGSDAVLSALGRARRSPADLETVALGNIVATMRRRGVRRIVVLASTAVRDPSDHPTTSQKLVLWLLKRFRSSVYEDSVGKARVIQGSDLDWTIARTSLLTDSPPSGKYRVGKMGSGTGTRLSRGDMAEFMVRCIAEARYVRESPYVSG